MKILFETKAGSNLYGTNSASSDLDIKGVFLPDLEDLILNRASKVITSSTGDKHSKNTSEDVDKSYYSLQYFLSLAAQGETNCIDILFAHSNKDAILSTTPEWEELIANRDKIITKNVKAFTGYCKSQCIKYSVKGEKLNNFDAFLNFCKEHLNEIDENGASIELRHLLFKYIPEVSELEVPAPDTRVKVNFTKESKINFGEHCYLLTAANKESYISISDVKFTFTDSVKSAYHKCLKSMSAYGERAKRAAEADGADMKAISHCVRVLHQVEELITTGEINFPLKSAEEIKKIKYNTTEMTREEIMEMIEDKLAEIDKLVESSTMREKADFKWIEKFILKCYGK